MKHPSIVSDVHWDDLHVLLESARAGSLSKAAVRLGVSVATVGRRLDRLEQQLGLKLFHRHPSGLTLTEHAPALLERAQRVAHGVRDFLAEAHASEDDLTRGEVVVTTFETMATHMVIPHLGPLLAAHPELRVSVRATPRVLKFADREVDIAIRVIKPTEQCVIAQRVAQMPYRLYAHPDYILAHGKPTLETLSAHTLVTYDARFHIMPEVAWLQMHAQGKLPQVRVTTLGGIYAAVLAGVGVGVLPHFMVPDVLVDLGPCEGLASRDIWFGVHEDLRHVPRVSFVYEYLREVIQAQCASVVLRE